MLGVKLPGREILVFICLLLLAPSAWAQQASGIAGVVRDTSGAVLPGVTVEAASPALIEKVRTVVADGEGRYNIVDLRPGTYSVTFTLSGFSTLKREGVVLTSGFTASVNVDLRVGTLEETVTVSGSAPLVDTQNVTQQKVLAEDVLKALPTGHTSLASLTILVPGLTGQTDVGGLGAIQNTSGVGASFHGKTGRKWSFDGMDIMNMQGSGNASFVLNQSMTEETSIETGGAGADSHMSGITINAIPKQGGNIFSGSADGVFSTQSMQSNNLDDELRSRGLTTVNRLLFVYNTGATLGGPIKKDRVWFYSGVKFVNVHSTVANIFYNQTPHTPFYTPDLGRPAERWESYEDYATRVTWQVSRKNKIGVYADAQPRCDCRRAVALAAPEAQTVYDFWPQGLYQVNWTMPVTNRLLVEAGVSMAQSHYTNPPPEGARLTPQDISITLSNGISYGSGTTLRTFTDSHRWSQRFNLSYVTGSHTFRTGFYQAEGVQDSEPYLNENQRWTFNVLCPANTPECLVPTTIMLDAGPYVTRAFMNADFGAYAQDQWKISRLSLSYGLRWEYFNAEVRQQHVDATRWLPARDFDPVPGVPLWKDWMPRIGAAYDVRGNGRTALKVSLGRYSGVTGVNIAAANNPILTSVNTVNRNWTDTNFNYIPDCDLGNFAANLECGAILNSNFGRNNPRAVTWDPKSLRGWGVRNFLWEFASEVQQELRPGLSVYGGFYRNWDGNNTVTDNTLVRPEDHDTYCITAPLDNQLPNGGGYQVCGLYDVKTALASTSQQNVTVLDKNFGREGGRVNTNTFLNFGFNARLAGNARVGGGVDTGSRGVDNCYVVDSPQTANLTYGYESSSFRNCDSPVGWMANLQVKINGSYNFPHDFVVSAVYQNIAGQNILANWAAPDSLIAPVLGRHLAACGTRTTCSSSATIPLIAANTLYEPRQSQLDLRVGKRIRLGGSKVLQGNIDLYNALNGNAIASRNNNYGTSRWGQAISVLDARMLQVSGRLTF